MPNFDPNESDRRLIQLRIDLDNIKKRQDSIYRKVLNSSNVFSPTTIIEAAPSQPVQTVFTGKGGANPTYPICEVPVGTIDGVNKFFTTSRSILAAPKPILMLNGAVQDPFNLVDFTYADNTILYAVAPEVGAFHTIWYWAGTGVASPARSFAGGTDILQWGSATPGSLYLMNGDMSMGMWFLLPPTAIVNNQLMFRGNGIFPPAAPAGNECYRLQVAGVSGAWNLTVSWEFGAGPTQISLAFTTNLPNNVWRYVGVSRDSVAKTVTMYIGDGVTLTTIGTQSYSNNPDGGTLGGLTVGGFFPANPSGNHCTIEEHYLWTRALSSAEHIAAMKGSPSTTNLTLWAKMGYNPEIDFSPTGAVGTVTGTTLVTGHP